jgi:hypothetical protein
MIAPWPTERGGTPIGVSAGGEAWIIPVIHDFGGVSHARQNRRPDSPIFAFSKRCVVSGVLEKGWWGALVGVLVGWVGLRWRAGELGDGLGGQMWTARFCWWW